MTREPIPQRNPPHPLVTLSIDASTYTGSVAVLRADEVLAEGETAMRGEREERLMPAVMRTLEIAGCSVRDVTRVVCGGGPGSFTSLRIAGAIAKGIAVGNGAELFEVSSLALIVAGSRPMLGAARYLALLDAMRDERYSALFEVDVGGHVLALGPARRLPASAVAQECERLGAVAIGPAADLRAMPHARGAGPMLAAILAAGPVALDGWEPAYGRLAEAQVSWEAAHGRALPTL